MQNVSCGSTFQNFQESVGRRRHARAVRPGEEPRRPGLPKGGTGARGTAAGPWDPSSQAERGVLRAVLEDDDGRFAGVAAGPH